MRVSWKAAAIVAASTAVLSFSAPSAGAAGSLHGSIALDKNVVGDHGASWGSAVNTSDQSAAERLALSECGANTCKVIVSWSNGCGSVVGSNSEAFVSGGVGATVEEAEQNAIAKAIGEHPALFQPRPASGSTPASGGQTPHVIVTKCTG